MNPEKHEPPAETPGSQGRRHIITAVFESDQDHSLRPQEWVECTYHNGTYDLEKCPQKVACFVEVKTRRGTLQKCFFWRHPPYRLSPQKCSHFQSIETDNFIHDVTHWKYLSEKLGKFDPSYAHIERERKWTNLEREPEVD